MASAARACRANAVLLFLVAVYVAITAVLSFTLDLEYSLTIYTPVWGVVAGIVLLAALLGGFSFTSASQRLWSGGEMVRERFLVAVPVLLVLPLFMSSFTSAKFSIGHIHPFELDHALVELDRLLHGGVSPWRLIHPVVGHPLATSALSIIYESWFLIMLVSVVAVAAWVERPLLRNQYLIAFLLCWAVLGTAAAIPLAAGGPCFYGLLHPTEPDPFRPLMTYLHEANSVYPVRALAVQESLWADVSSDTLRLGSGISATPSLHVAIATLQAILAWKISRAWGVAATIFLVLILVGSVHLGWHYAIDGYISIVAVPAIWAVAGWLARLEWKRGRVPQGTRDG